MSTELTDTEKRNTIAKIHGWHMWQCVKGMWWLVGPTGIRHGCCMDSDLDSQLVQFSFHVPDYLNDLNAMHEVESVKFDALVAGKYWLQLLDIATRDKLPPVGHWQLSARQRADAFLATIKDL